MGLVRQWKNAYYGVRPSGNSSGPYSRPHFTDRKGGQPPVHFPDRESFINFCREVKEATGSAVAVRLVDNGGEYRNDLTPEQVLNKLPREPLMLALSVDGTNDQIILDNRKKAATSLSVGRDADPTGEVARREVLANLLWHFASPIPVWKRRLNVPVASNESRDRVLDRRRATAIRWQSWVGGAVFGLLGAAAKSWMGF